MTNEVKKLILSCKTENIYDFTQEQGVVLIKEFLNEKIGKSIHVSSYISSIREMQLYDHYIKKALDYYLPLIEQEDGKPSIT